MKTGITRKQKVTEFYFNEHDDLAEIYTHNTDLKKRLLAYAKEYPELCQLTEDDEQGGLRFEIDKHRIGIRLTAPYSSERRAAASRKAKEQQNWEMRTLQMMSPFRGVKDFLESINVMKSKRKYGNLQK